MLHLHNCKRFATNRVDLLNGQGPTLILAQASGAVAAALTCPCMSLHAILDGASKAIVATTCTLHLRPAFAAARYLFVSRGQAKAEVQNSLVVPMKTDRCRGGAATFAPSWTWHRFFVAMA